MIELMVNGDKHLLIGRQDKCPICDTPYNKMFFRWRVFHGAAESSCCGAVYQLKGYYIENPTDEQKELLRLLSSDEYIEFKLKEDWIAPLRTAIEEIGIKDINNHHVKEFAAKLRENSL